MFDDKLLINPAATDTWRSTWVYRQRLGVEDAELLIKFLCYLTWKLNQVATVQLAISPVKPEQEQDLKTSMTDSKAATNNQTKQENVVLYIQNIIGSL